MNRLVLATATAAAFTFAACGGGGSSDAPDAAPPGPDAAVCDVDPAGVCVGDELHSCDGDLLDIVDCTDTLAGCVAGAGGAACVDACTEAGATDAGTCAGPAIERCVVLDGKHAVTTEPCGPGSTCEVGPGGASCVVDSCAAVGPQGHCNGTVLTRCSGGAPTETDCALTSQACAYVNDASGYGCVDPVTAGAFAVNGTIRYEDRAPLPTGGLGALTPQPVRGAQVSVVRDSDSMVLVTGLTSDDGSYALRYTAADGAQVHVNVASRSPLTIRPITVMRTQSAVHGFGGASFAAAAAVTSDLLVTDASATSEAFNVLDQLIRVMDMIRGDLGDATPSPLVARWSRGSNDGTYYNGQIRLLGASSDDDGYDDTVILHEAGHYVEDTQGRSDSQGGGHDGSPTDPNLAWSEGFSTYLAMAVNGPPFYADSNSGGGWGYNAETSTESTPQPGGTMSQDVSEDMVSAILWDLADGGATDDDPMIAGSHPRALRVQSAYLRSASLRNVGEPGVDLVDWLDGWFVGDGLSSCAAVRAVVTAMRGFPYDYAGPAGACPP